jgi:hypothetical protein
MDVICILNDVNSNYIINNNEIIYSIGDACKSDFIEKQLSCKFSKIINNDNRMSTNYYSEIIYDLKENSLRVPSVKNTNTIFLIGEHNNTFSNLVKRLIEEFVHETVSFNFYIHEIKYNGVYDLILNKFFDINTEKLNGFSKSKIFLDGFDKDINKKKNEIIESLENVINGKKDLSYIICTFENHYNKITIYNLSDIENIIDTEETDITLRAYTETKFPINYKNYFGLIDHTFIKATLLNIQLDKNKTMEESHLMNYFDDSIKNNFKVIYNLTKISPRTWELVSLFYSYTKKSNKLELVPYKKPEQKPVNVPKNYTLNSSMITKYNKSNNILKPKEKSGNNYKILEKPHSLKLNDLSGGLVNYGNKHKIVSAVTKGKPSIKTKNSDDNDFFGLKKSYTNNDKLVFELMKHISQPEDPVLTFDKLMIYNKFMFNQCVKNHLKLQNAHKNPKKLKTVNDELICEMRALLTVMLDQINEL